MFAGTWTLIKLILRRDRVKLPIWIVGIVGLLLSMIPMLRDVYGDTASLESLYQTFGTNPAGLFLTGPMDGPTFGSLMTIETLLWWGLAIAFMNTMLVVRHTRQNEESGAQELLLSGQVHRRTGLVAVMAVAVVVNAIVAVGLGLGMALEPSWGVDQAWLFAISMGVFGMVWAVIAAIVVQLVESARTANGLLAALVGGAFLLRGIGDFMGKADASGLVQPSWPSWLSPFGWLQASRPLTYPEWWPLIIAGVFIVVAMPAAFFLLGRRDVGAGLLPSRKGKARAASFLRTPLGLAWYLQKSIFIGWLIGVLVLVIIIGALVPEMTTVYESSQNMQLLIEAMGGTGALVPAFLSAMLSITILMVLAYAVHALGKLRSEESSGHLEGVLATTLSRTKWIVLHMGIVVGCGAAMLALSGAILAVSVNMVSDFHASIGDYTLAGVSYLPLYMVFVGMYVLLFGVLPRTAGFVTWLYYGFVAFMAWLGPILKLDQWVLDLSIMAHLPAAPAESIESAPLIVMLMVAVVLIIAGCVFWRRRNLLER